MSDFTDKAKGIKVNLTELVDLYSKIQTKLVNQIKELSGDTENAQPGAFLEAQFQMSLTSQIGDSISNLISQTNAIIGNSVRNLGK